jgi:hypothetical protein
MISPTDSCLGDSWRTLASESGPGGGHG